MRKALRDEIAQPISTKAPTPQSNPQRDRPVGGIQRKRQVMKRSEYLDLRRLYEPQSLVRLVIIAESPPASGKYFYDPTGATSEWLFAALMKQIGFSPSNKEEGLREFQRRGWILIDATYEPVAFDERIASLEAKLDQPRSNVRRIA
jgi:hypothetical protein